MDDLVVIETGQPVLVEYDASTRFRDVARAALEARGRRTAVDVIELRDEQGYDVDLDGLVADRELDRGVLFCHLKPVPA